MIMWILLAVSYKGPITDVSSARVIEANFYSKADCLKAKATYFRQIINSKMYLHCLAFERIK